MKGFYLFKTNAFRSIYDKLSIKLFWQKLIGLKDDFLKSDRTVKKRRGSSVYKKTNERVKTSFESVYSKKPFLIRKVSFLLLSFNFIGANRLRS